MKAAISAIAVAIAALQLAPPAFADTGDYITELDNRGVYYTDLEGITKLGKLVCSALRSDMTPRATRYNLTTPLEHAGYNAPEAAIIIVSATRNLCPDQIPEMNGILQAQ